MTFYSLFIIAIALSLDAFGVALSVGLDRKVALKNKILFSLSFGFFQFLFSYIGSYAGFLFNTYIASMPKLIGGVVITIVGIVMFKEGFEKKSENIFLNPKMYFILGISVSIDAVVIGFTVLNNIINNLIVFKYTLFIGLVTFIVSGIAFIISKYLNKVDIISKYADFIGGIILVIFGLKMIIF
ncbi:manganese efflux pump MntP [Clostridium acetireducens DSM 10703]|uniref:Putative manganese efflux pump MntP n=1 Tax=Clostridium acetireducens DSM 10703 TaxID=1121290 RepID=A0A1E8EY64_9CLOT|nr:manganese efflux pump [Clostridium acetireducens]OFI05876.1 manganese efflux pump MntP [Clostridium acetireducens DSM 10703]